MKIWSLIFALLFVKNIQAQTNDECKYFQVITFIRTNAEFNSQMKDYINFNKTIKKAKFIDLNISPWIRFIEFREFKNKVNSDSIGLNNEIVSDERLYFKTYNFKPFKSVFLEKTIEKNEAKLYLTFSKVNGNTLLVEILNFENHPNSIIRIGSGVKILFIFDQSGFIKTTLFNKIVYN